MNIYSHQNQFLDNKYTRWYYDMVSNALSQNRKKLKRNNPDYVYYERHHILPQCWFPEYKKETWNTVLLTAKEHWICHRLLTKMTFGALRHKMICAVVGLLRAREKQDRWIPSGRVYQRIREDLSRSMSLKQTGKSTGPQSIETRKKRSLSRTGKGTGPRSAESIAKQVATITGKKRNPHTEQAKANISASLIGKSYEDRFGKERANEIKKVLSTLHKGRPKSIETRARMKAAKKGLPLSQEVKRKISESLKARNAALKNT
jgi:hypothetical protein